MTEPFFHADADTFVPTVLCQGPWDPGHAHGGPPSALLARAVEQHEPDPSLGIGRILLDLVRPRALRIRRVPDTVAPQAPPIEPVPFAGPDGSVVEEYDGPRVGIMLGVELRTVVGRFRTPGPATGWFRLTAPLVAGEVPTPVQRTMVAADFGNGISQVLGEDFVFINPDLVVHFEREPIGEWIGLAATTRLTAGAGALATGTLYDTTGRVGQSEQSLYVGPRPGA